VPGRDEIKYIILNTGDRLEGVRAEEEGAAYVYGDPIERDNPIQTLFFIPGEVGTINVDKLIKQTQKRLQRVFDDMRKSFADVLANMKKAITPKGTFDPQYSYLGGTSYVANPEQNALATKFMKSAIASVEAVSNAMNTYCAAEYQTILQVGTSDNSTYLNKINDAYKMWNARAELYAPSTTSILRKSGDIIRIHPIISLPKGVTIQKGGLAGKTAEGGLEGSFTIFYADALEAIRNPNERLLQARTPMWARGPPPPPAPPAAAAARPAADAPPMEDDRETIPDGSQRGGGAIYEKFDSSETEKIYESVIRSADAMFKDVMSTPRPTGADTTDALNAFSCYLNKRNSSRFGVEVKYQEPTPEEIAAISPEAHSDTFSIPAYFAHLEKAYLETSKTGVSNLAELQIHIVSEFTGPLALFASYMNVPIKKAVAIFLDVNKKKCIDETLYESIEDDLRFCMFDSLPAEATENTQGTVENSAAKVSAQGKAKPGHTTPRIIFRSLSNRQNTSPAVAAAAGRRTFRRRLPKLL
jgi:hypothetical protein